MADSSQIIELYTQLADNPQKDFGWAKGLENAKAHNYSKEWFEKLPREIWRYCAATGNPFELGDIKKGFTVVDLGCGAGVDLLISAYLVGESGKAIGVDITPKMVEKAQEHAKLAGFENVEVLESSFDDVNIADESMDVVISNGAINLTSCKQSVFKEIYRILKPDGKIYFADMVDISTKEECCESEAESCCDTGEDDWANCVAGTLRVDELVEIIKETGFRDVECVSLNHYTTAETTKGATFRATKISSKDIREEHWDSLFKRVDYKKVFWYQKNPSKSLELIQKYSNKDSSIIDTGCGVSYLVDMLIEDGYSDITLLDVAKTSLEVVKERVGDSDTTYVCSDILNYKTEKKMDIWHDRAVFHFLNTSKEQVEYFEVLEDTLSNSGVAIVSTFRINGPISCAGLDITQYDEEKLKNILPKTLELVEYENYTHITPKETEQEYIYFVLKKRANP